MTGIPFYIVVFNRLSGLRNALNFAESSTLRVKPVILDMGSTYPPMVQYLEDSSVQVVRPILRKLEAQRGASGHLLTGLWTSGLLSELGSGEFFLSDGDLDYSDTSPDTLGRLREYGKRFPWLPKVGTALRVDDLPRDDIGQRVVRWESWNWKVAWDSSSYLASVDTTLAYYPDRGRSFYFRPALRLAGEHTVRHSPWYERDGRLSDVAAFYREVALSSLTHASGQSLPDPRYVPKRAFEFLARAMRRPLRSRMFGPRSTQVLSWRGRVT